MLSKFHHHPYHWTETRTRTRTYPQNWDVDVPASDHGEWFRTVECCCSWDESYRFFTGIDDIPGCELRLKNFHVDVLCTDDLRINFVFCWVITLQYCQLSISKSGEVEIEGRLTIPRIPFSDWIQTLVSGDKNEGASVGIPVFVYISLLVYFGNTSV